MKPYLRGTWVCIASHCANRGHPSAPTESATTPQSDATLMKEHLRGCVECSAGNYCAEGNRYGGEVTHDYLTRITVGNGCSVRAPSAEPPSEPEERPMPDDFRCIADALQPTGDAWLAMGSIHRGIVDALHRAAWAEQSAATRYRQLEAMHDQLAESESSRSALVEELRQANVEADRLGSIIEAVRVAMRESVRALTEEVGRLRIIERDYNAMCDILREHAEKHPRSPSTGKARDNG